MVVSSSESFFSFFRDPFFGIGPLAGAPLSSVVMLLLRDRGTGLLGVPPRTTLCAAGTTPLPRLRRNTAGRRPCSLKRRPFPRQPTPVLLATQSQINKHHYPPPPSRVTLTEGI